MSLKPSSDTRIALGDDADGVSLSCGDALQLEEELEEELHALQPRLGVRIRKRKKRSKKCPVARYETQLTRKYQQLQQLASEHVLLRVKEAVLLQQALQQGDVVFHLGSISAQELAVAAAAAHGDAHGSSAVSKASQAALKAMLADVQAQQLLHTLSWEAGSKASRKPQACQDMEDFTGKALCAAVTPERVQYVQSASLQELAKQVRELSMRVTLLAHMDPVQQLHMASTLQKAMDEYGQLNQLMHVAAERKLMKMCTMNLETLEEQEPPANIWEVATDKMQLRQDQAQQLHAAFQLYAAKRAKIIRETQQPLTQRLQQLLGPPPAASICPQGGEGPGCDDTAAAAGSSGSGGDGGSATRAGALSNSVAGGCWTCSSTATAVGSGAAGKGSCRNCSGQVPVSSSSSGRGASLLPELELLALGQTPMLEQLLDEIEQMMQLQRKAQRPLVYLTINLLNNQQRAAAIAHCYPFIPQVQAICEVVSRRYEATQVAAAYASSKNAVQQAQ